MAVSINVLSTFNDAGLKRAQSEIDKLSANTKNTAGKIGQQGALLGAGILGAAGAVGVGLFNIGSSFDDAFDQIRVGTGATGPVLEGLQSDMKAVASAVPASFGDVGSVITAFNQKLGLTGAPLQLMSEQVLELSRITKTDLGGNVEAVASVMQNFGVATGDQSGKLDLLFRASQKSGVSVAELSAQMADSGVVLRDVGLTFDQSAAFLATLGKAGVDAGDVMPALSKAMAVAAKNGKDASVVFQETFDKIKNAPNDTEAAGAALDVFGAKAGPKLAAMIREGKLSFEEMQASLANGDSIIQAGADTQDFAEKLTTLKNKVFLALEPIATKVFTKIGEVVEQLTPKIEELSKFMTENKEAMIIAAGVIGGIAVIAVTAYAISMAAAAIATIAAAAPIIAIVALIALLVGGVIYAYKNFETFRNVIQKAWEIIQQVIKFAWENVIKVIFAAIVIYIKFAIQFYTMLWKAIVFAFETIMAIVLWVWNNVILFVFDAIMLYIKIVIAYYTMLWEGIKFAFGIISYVVMTAWGVMSGVFDSIKNGIAGVADWIGEKVGAIVEFFTSIPSKIGHVGAMIGDALGDAFKGAWNFLSDTVNRIIPDSIGIGIGPELDLPDNPLPRFHAGGVVPGLAGQNVPTMLSAGEMVLTRSQQSALLSGNTGGGNSYTINVSVAPTADKAGIGQTIVEAISSFEKRSGASWRAA
jgi:TP901 family phage tail tape measure protein